MAELSAALQNGDAQITLAVLVLAVALFISGVIAPELVGLLSLGLLMIGGVLTPLQALTRLGSPALITPMGYQTNLMVFGPGRYRFFDVARYGLGLTVLMTLLVPWLILNQMGGA